ncbi:MAG: winged helix-turn-helix transcriptional regulator [Nitrosopumilaceae archaeon]|nr:winged helix-turn-helix transcriptional regulator [Nitrosopumilaceae archaeon]
MARGYPIHDVRRRLITALGGADAKGGMSGVELARALGMSRTTVSKYLQMLAADGTLDRREVGNVTLWSLRPGQESFAFPDDYFRAASAYMECIRNASESVAVQVVRNCIRSGASSASLVLDVVLPASDAIRDMYETGKIGAAEQNYLGGIISRSLHEIGSRNAGVRASREKGRSALVIAADSRSGPVSHAACSIYRSRGWTVFELGDMSAAAGVLFDLDFERLAGKVWNPKDGPLITVVFSSTAEGLNFFADSIYPVSKRSRRMHLLLCGRGLAEPVSGMKSCDYYIDGDVSKVIQISDAISAR